MRKYAVLQHPAPMNDRGDLIRKVMIYQADATEVYLFLYTSTDEDGSSSGEEYYLCLADAEERCEEFGLAPEDWIAIDDPLPFCQHDTVTPIRVKGREQGKPEYGTFEVMRNGVWEQWNREDPR